MTRALLGLVLLIAVAAFITSNRTKPLLITESHHADYQVCARVEPAPLRPPRKDAFRPTVSEKV